MNDTMRLGELLIREGIITAAELERALQRSEQQKVRLGTALVELGFADVDTVARALSAMHQVPAVLSKHVANVDRAVIALVPRLVATSHRAVPIGWTPTKPPRLVVAFQDPRTTPTEDFAVAAAARIEVGVAPELLVNRLLSKHYGVTSSTVNMRFVDVDPASLQKPPSEPPAPKAEQPVLTLSLPPLPMPPEEEEVAEPQETRTSQAPASQAPASDAPASLVPVLGADDAVEALKATTTSDEIGNVLATWLHSTYGLGLVFVVKDILGMAIGWRGWAPDVQQITIESISVPLGPPSMFTTVYEGKIAFLGPPPEEGMPTHRKVWTALGGDEPLEALVIPVMLGERMVNILYSHSTTGTFPDGALEDAARVAREATTAYARLIRRPKPEVEEK
jgi:hypothetical protein